MPRDADTALFTRVDNSFSNPVFGTTIDPTNADTFFDDVDSALNAFIGQSSTSLSIATGSKSFTLSDADADVKAFLVGEFVQAFSQADHANYMYGTVTSYTRGTGVLVVNVTAIGGSGTLADWLIVQSGAQGPTGATGSQGEPGLAGYVQAYDSSTTDSDPGNGKFRFNNATVADATAAYLDNLDADGGTVSGIVDLYDDSTNTVKGTLRFQKTTDAGVWADFQVTGSVVDGTGYRKVTLQNGQSAGTFTATDEFSIAFTRAGDVGADGTMTGPGSSVTGNLPSFDDTSGDVLNDSGIPATAIKGLVQTYTSGYSSVAGDLNKLTRFNHASTPQTWALLAAATAGNGFTTAFENINTALLTLDGDGSETIDGALTMALAKNMRADLVCDGSSWKSKIFYPAFLSEVASPANLTSDTWTKVAMNAKTFDTHGYYDTATNYRFTTLRAGWYFVFIYGSPNGESGQATGLAIYKNGSGAIYTLQYPGGNSAPNAFGFGLIYLNGSTDYVEMYGYASNATPSISSCGFGAFRIF